MMALVPICCLAYLDDTFNYAPHRRFLLHSLRYLLGPLEGPHPPVAPKQNPHIRHGVSPWRLTTTTSRPVSFRLLPLLVP
jgi:hypothetical protein